MDYEDITLLTNPKYDDRHMVDFETYRNIHSDEVGFKRTYVNTQAQKYMESEIMDKNEPPEEFEMLFPPKIPGFNLRRKKWGKHDKTS